MKDTEIIICTEEGHLEKMAKLLVYSIRNLTGEFRNTPIYSYQPRKNNKVSKETKKFFEDNDVNLIDEPLNTKYNYYPLANKPLACAHREKLSTAKYLLFLDTDTFFLDEPNIYNRLNNIDIALNPVDFNNIGTDINFSSGEKDFWKSLYNLLDIQSRKIVKTNVDKKYVLEYYNSGFILSKKENLLFSRWWKNFDFIMSKKIKPKKGLFFLEQSVFSATVAQMNLDLAQLGKNYNYPLDSYSRKWRGLFPFSLKNVKHVHYHKLFKDSRRNPINRKLRQVKNGPMINKAIDEYLLK